jgi:hypothetical protein
MLDGVDLGVVEHVAPRDPHVEVPGGDIDGDVTRAEVEELDLILGVDEAELAGVAAAAIPGVAEHHTGGLG